jgi:glycosyltransferase involved in cell wall biosynthesis
LEVKQNLTWETGLAELVAKSRGVIIPSIWPTTTEFGLIEALGYGKPVICFDLGIHHEKIVNGINGFIANLGDSKEIAAQLIKLRTDDQLFYTISENAGLLYKEMINWNGWIRDLKYMGL